MPFARSEGLKRLDERWHNARIEARRNAFSVEEFSDADRVAYDLDTAQITGKDNPLTYRIDRPVDILDSNGADVRDMEDR